MDTLKNQKPVYQMTSTERDEARDFVILVGRYLEKEKWERFRKFFDHLCLIQNPSNLEHPYTDSLSHGIVVAKICMRCKSDFSEVLLLAAVGHDWDRACGEKRIASSDYPNTVEGSRLYKEAHAKNSALLFCAEMEKFYPSEIVEKVRHYILNHEIGGEGELAILDFADGMAFFTPQLTDYFRNQRIYLDAEKNPLPSLEMEQARKRGFEIKVKFMIENMNESCSFTVKAFVRTNLSCFEVNVINELMDIMEL